MTNMSKILWEGHALSTDPTFPRAYEASILNPLHYKFLATPLVDGIQIWTVWWRPEVRTDEVRCLPLQQLDGVAGAMCRSANL